MNNLKTFEQFVFEGSGDACAGVMKKKKKPIKKTSLKPNKWMKWEDVKEDFDFFNRPKMENTIHNIFKKIKDEFKTEFTVNKLTTGYEAGESRLKYYEYIMQGGDRISVSEGGGEYHRNPVLYLNNKNVSEDVSKNTIKIIYNFFDDKYNNIERNPINIIKRIRRGDTIKSME
jgi:hypothetical protein